MKKIISIFLIFNILIFSILKNIAFADERDELQSQINQTNSKIQEEKENLNKITNQKQSAKEQVEELTSQILEYELEIEALDDKITELNVKITDAQSQITKKEEEYEEAQELLAKRLVSNYKNSNLTYIEILFNSKSFTEILDSYYLVNKLVEADNKLMEEIENKRKEIEEQKNTLEQNKKELQESKTQKEAKNNQLITAKNEKNKQIEQLTQSEKESQEKIDSLNAQNKEINAQLAAAQKAYAEKIALLEAQKNQSNNSSSSSNSNSSNSSSTVVSGSGILQPPCSGPITTRMYYSSGVYHGALDYGIPVGTTIRAAADGVVLSVQSLSSSYGNFIVIQHAGGLRTWYAHGNGVFYVSAGETVSRGQAIMQSGNSGNSSRPHLHFEVRVSPYNYSYGGNDSRRNPEAYF